jgi:hypothetical protein
MSSKKLRDAISLLSGLIHVSYGDFIVAMLCNPGSPTYLAAYKIVFPERYRFENETNVHKVPKIFL